jgi:hypothetical protein
MACELTARDWLHKAHSKYTRELRINTHSCERCSDSTAQPGNSAAARLLRALAACRPRSGLKYKATMSAPGGRQ